MDHPPIYYQKLTHQITIVMLLTLPIIIGSPATRVVDFGPKLPEFIEQHPDKSWLIKFYAPWCHHCQQIETTFNNVGEKIYHKYDNLIVGQVDCTKHVSICEKYGVQAYPVIMFINQHTLIKYKEGRNEAALIDFAERLNGPDVRSIDDCNHMKSLTNQHGHIVLSTEKNLTSAIHEEFKSLASLLKANWWFYHYGKSCKNLVEENGLYILKKHLNRAIKFNSTQTEIVDLKNAITTWIARQSFPIFGELNWMNCERALASKKLLVIAILDEYKPAKNFSPTSRDLHRSFEKLARKNSQIDEDLMFVWSSDLDLVRYITIGEVSVPNVMLLRSDYSYKLLVTENSHQLGEKGNVVSDRLQERNIKMLIAAAKLGDMAFDGGNSLLYTILRNFYINYNKFVKVYKSDPLLATILVIFPTLIVIFVLYQTCMNNKFNSEELNRDEDEEDYSEEDEEQRRLLSNHAKQD